MAFSPPVLEETFPAGHISEQNWRLPRQCSLDSPECRNPPDQYLKQVTVPGIWCGPGGTSPGYLKQLEVVGIWRRPGGADRMASRLLAPGGTSAGQLKHVQGIQAF
jgi:hypothetical protein